MMPLVFMSFPKVEIRRKHSMTFFAVLAIAMVIGSYLFVFLLAAACVILPYLIIANSENPSGQILLLLLFGIVIAAAMLWSLIPRRDKFKPPGLLLDPASHPKLFKELKNIAAALGEELPLEVYLVADPNAFVADRGGILGFGSRRIMGLGLPLLSTMTISQFRAVLAHEFAHYYGGDTGLGPWVYKSRSAMIRLFQNIGSVGSLARIAILGAMYLVVVTLLKWYFIAFLRVTNLVSRKQEYRADELACIVAGRQNLIDGLQTVHAATIGWPAYWKNEVAPTLSGGSLVALGDGFSRFLVAPGVSSAISSSLQKRLQEEKTAPYDTHPPLRDRIAAVRNLADGSPAEDTNPALTLLQDVPKAEMALVEQCVEDVQPGTLQYVLWDQIAARVTIPEWQKFVTEYAGPVRGVTAERLPHQVPHFREIGSRIRDPKGMLLSPEQRTFRAAYLFAAALALAMVRVEWVLDVAPGVFHLRRGDREFNPFRELDELMKGKLTPAQWVAKCQELGIARLYLLSPEGAGQYQDNGAIQEQLFGADGNQPV